MVTYVKGDCLPDGAITTTIIEQEWYQGKPFVKKCFTTLSGNVNKRTENKKVKQDKMIEKAKAEVQSKLDVFKQVDIEEEGF